MADPYVGLGLQGVNLATNKYEDIRDPVVRHWDRMRGKHMELEKRDKHVREKYTPEEQGLVLRRRRDVGSDEEIVEVVRHRGEVLPQKPGRPGNRRRTSSMADMRSARGGGAVVPYNRRRGNDDASDSEGSVPPRSRVRARSAASNKSRRRRGSSSSSKSSSDLGSTSAEEKECRKQARKKWITGALASVATIHAVSKVYTSIENHDKRAEEVRAGTLSPEKAHKLGRQARWQDAAAIGIAALGIKGAISEWKELKEENEHHLELLEKHEEQHHRKRLEHERRRRARDNGGYYKGRDGNWYYNGNQPQRSTTSGGGSLKSYDEPERRTTVGRDRS